MKDVSTLKVAIVHDWLVGGGAELVVEQLHKLFPEAPIYTSYATDEWRRRLDDKVVTGWLQHFGKLRKFMVLGRIWWFEHLDFSAYDLVISSSGNGEAFSVKTPDSTMHICYCHTPTHYYWRNYEQYLKHPGFGLFDPLARLGLRLLVGPLRKWDLKASQRPDYFLANSTHIQADIKTYYGRNSTVLFPPIYMERFEKPENRGLQRYGFVISGRQTPYKRFDLAVEACNKLGLPLTVIGNGPEHERLQKLAGPTITVAGRLSDADVERAFASAKAFLFPAQDDFGITPVEAMASGTPVIAYQAGGALDYVKPGVTGEFFPEQTVESLVATLQAFDSSRYRAATITAAASQFSSQAFRQKFQTFLEQHLQH